MMSSACEEAQSDAVQRFLNNANPYAEETQEFDERGQGRSVGRGDFERLRL